MKCWIIEQGSYSDYHVVGIFTSKEKAETALNYMNTGDPYDDPSIDERELDPCIEELNEGLTQYLVRMLNDGSLTISTTIRVESTDTIWDQGAAYNVWARDKDHAIKIAAERDAIRKAGILLS